MPCACFGRSKSFLKGLYGRLFIIRLLRTTKGLRGWSLWPLHAVPGSHTRHNTTQGQLATRQDLSCSLNCRGIYLDHLGCPSHGRFCFAICVAAFPIVIHNTNIQVPQGCTSLMMPLAREMKLKCVTFDACACVPKVLSFGGREPTP